MLLKGGGYLAADLPNGHGRRVADLDVLVPEVILRVPKNCYGNTAGSFRSLIRMTNGFTGSGCTNCRR